jgi:hypothetical protein
VAVGCHPPIASLLLNRERRVNWASAMDGEMRRLLLALSIIATAAFVAQTGGTVPVLSAAPGGFTDVVVADVGSLTTVEALPDGRVVVLEKNGDLLRIEGGLASSEVVTLATFDVCIRPEYGRLGLTLDPTYESSGRVYVYRTVASSEPGGCDNRVSAFNMNEDRFDLASGQILVDRISSVAGNHNGGDIEIGNDGFLYIAVGDAGRDPRGDSGSTGNNDAGQDRSLLNGKVLRVDRFTGFAGPGKPFTGGVRSTSASVAIVRTRRRRSVARSSRSVFGTRSDSRSIRTPAPRGFSSTTWGRALAKRSTKDYLGPTTAGRLVQVVACKGPTRHVRHRNSA